MILLWLLFPAFIVSRFATRKKRKARKAVKAARKPPCILDVYAAQKVARDKAAKASAAARQRSATTAASPETAAEKALERERKAAEKIAFKKQQAAADKQFIEQQLDKIGDLLIAIDREKELIEQKISIDIQTRSYDSEMKDRRKKEQIVKKMLALERQIHALEIRLAKANYIINGSI